MRSRLLVVTIAVVSMAASSLLAETGSGALRVSVSVVRSCRVSTDAPSVSVDCGARPQPVQIIHSTTSASGKISAASRAVTIEF